MSSLAQYQNVFRIAKNDSSNYNAGSRSTTRIRRPVSCTTCRIRKVKCDQLIPCTQCSIKGNDASCSLRYSTRDGYSRSDEASKVSKAHICLQKLEEMVTTLMQTVNNTPVSDGGAKSASPGDSIHQSSVSQNAETFPQTSGNSSRGRLEVYGSETSYMGSTHWATMLQDIRDIQDFLEPERTNSEKKSPFTLDDGPDLIFEETGLLTLAQTCESLPQKHKVDKLLAVYFNKRYFQFPFMHTGKFQREYELFWTDPSSISFLWISMLFSALQISSKICEASGQVVLDPDDTPLRSAFLARAGQALITGEYRKARPYSVEAVFMYAICKYSQKEDADPDAWMIAGISARLAMRMGYHQDPRRLSHISPFEGEMRRRTFSLVETFELLLAFQAGLPAIMHEEDIDTEHPNNLLDEDFDEDCTALPPSRPPTDPTPMLYFCYKGRLARIFRRITRHTLSSRTATSYEETLKLDAELREMQANIPPSLRLKPLASSFVDQAYTIAHRINIDCLYHKSLCVLHRKYLSQKKYNPEFDYSRQTCTDAALQLLKNQADIHAVTQPGGQFYDDRWMLSSSLTLSDFLLGAMVCSLDLYESHQRPNAASSVHLESQAKKYDAIKLSHDIWMSRRAFSRDARLASNILGYMLSKVPRPNINPDSTKAPQSMSNALQPPITDQGSMGVDSSDTVSGDATAVSYIGQDVALDDFDSFDFNSVDPLNTLFDGADNINWSLVDQYLYDHGGDRGPRLL